MCAILGGVTAWLVAWGIVAAEWKGVASSDLPNQQYGVAIVEPHLVNLYERRSPTTRVREWIVTQLDERIVPDAPTWRETLADEGPDAVLERVRAYNGQSTEPALDRFAQAFASNRVAGLIIDEQAYIIRERLHGWPFASVAEIRAETFRRLSGGTFGSAPVRFDDTKTVSIPWLTGHDPVWNLARRGNPTTIQFPYRPDWPGLAGNAAFYGLLWALPLIGFPIVRRRARMRRARCGSCNYDLCGTTSGVCPECGLEFMPIA